MLSSNAQIDQKVVKQKKNENLYYVAWNIAEKKNNTKINKQIKRHPKFLQLTQSSNNNKLKLQATYLLIDNEKRATCIETFQW